MMRTLLVTLTVFASPVLAGDFSIHEKDARIFSKLILRCIKEGDAECLIARSRKPVVLDDPKNFGCPTKAPGIATPEEFANCLLDGKTKSKVKNRLRTIVSDCLSQKAEFDENFKALRGKTKYWCFLGEGEVIGDDPQFAQISKQLEWK